MKDDKRVDETKKEFLKRFEDFGKKDYTEVCCNSRKTFEEQKERWEKQKLKIREKNNDNNGIQENN